MHVVALVSARTSVADPAQRLKGYSSCELNRRIPMAYPLGWQKGYFAESVSPTKLDGLSQVTSDRRWGTYVLVGYKLPFFRQVMPYVMHEFIRSSEQLHSEGFNADFTHYPAGVLDIYKYTFGLNYHVQPNLVVKVQYGTVEHRGPNVFGMGDNSSEWFVQTAWAF